MNVKQMRKRASHAANLKRSERLQRLLKALRADCYKTTCMLQTETGSMAVHSDIHELRCEGIPVAPAKYFGKNSNGKKIYGYKLMEKV
jgi:hypothetical protein